MAAYSAYSGAQAQKGQAEYQAKVASNNAQVAEWQANDAVQRGNQASFNQRRKGQQAMGTQRAAMAAAGLDVATGSALSILEDTNYFNQMDQQTIKDNAAREAWGYKVQGMNAQASAGMYQNTADHINPLVEGTVAGVGSYYGKNNSLMSSGSTVNPKWYTGKPANASNYGGTPDISNQA